ncbi:MAG: hypothetical protein R3Y49_05535 [Rikenellaceae bacterium]
MSRIKKNFTTKELNLRSKIEAELNAIPHQNPTIARFGTLEGFSEYYQRMENLYPTKQEAYERLEDFHIKVFGYRRYAEYNSLREMIARLYRKGHF